MNNKIFTEYVAYSDTPIRINNLRDKITLILTKESRSLEHWFEITDLLILMYEIIRLWNDILENVLKENN